MEIFSKTNIARMLLALQVATVIFLIPQSSLQAEAYSSWIQDTEVYREFYDLNNTAAQNTTDAGEASWFEQLIAELIARFGLLMGNAMEGSNINISIDGIIYGRLKQPNKISYTSFDLSENNIYGLVGSAIYVTLRGLIYSGFFIMFLFLLVKGLIKTGPRAREEIKQGIYSILLGFALIYFMPQLIDICLFVRDIFLKMTIAGIGASSGTVLDSIKLVFDQEKTILSAAVLFAAIFAGLFYLKDYIAIAVQHTLLFAFFPGVCLMGVVKKKLMSEWAAMFFGNLLVPVFDAICIMLPALALKAFQGNITLGICFIVLCLIFSARTARQQVMKLVSNATGAPVGGGGIGGMGAMATAMGARMIAGALRKGSSGGYHADGSGNSIEGYGDWKNEIGEQNELAESMTRQGREISESLEDVNDMLSHSGDTGSGSAPGNWEDAKMDADLSLPAESVAADTVPDITPEGSGNGDAMQMQNGEEQALHNGEVQSLQNDSELSSIETQEPYAPLQNVDSGDTMAASMSDPAVTAGSPQLGEFDQARMENLEKLDSARDELQRVQSIQARSSQLDSDISALQAERDAITKQNSSYPSTGTMLSSSDQRRVEEIDNRINTLQNQKSQVNKELAAVPKAETLQNTIRKREVAEKSYARISEEHGRSGKTYENSLAMKQSMERRDAATAKALEAAKKGAQMSRKDLEKLSPEAAAQIASIQKDVARKNNIKKAITTPMKVAAVGAGALSVATLAAYGGERAAMTGALVGAMSTRGTMKAGRHLVQNAENIGEQMIDTGKGAKEALDKNKGTLNAERRHWLGDERTVLEKPSRPPRKKDARREGMDVAGQDWIDNKL